MFEPSTLASKTVSVSLNLSVQITTVPIAKVLGGLLRAFTGRSSLLCCLLSADVSAVVVSFDLDLNATVAQAASYVSTLVPLQWPTAKIVRRVCWSSRASPVVIEHPVSLCSAGETSNERMDYVACNISMFLSICGLTPSSYSMAQR